MDWITLKKRGEEEIWMRENTPEMTKQKRGAHNNLVSCAAHKINETSPSILFVCAVTASPITTISCCMNMHVRVFI